MRHSSIGFHHPVSLFSTPHILCCVELQLLHGDRIWSAITVPDTPRRRLCC
jgi:hypothetical protein